MNPINDLFPFSIEEDECRKSMGMERELGELVLVGTFDAVEAVGTLENRSNIGLSEFGFHLHACRATVAVDEPQVDFLVWGSRGGGEDEKCGEDHFF